MNHIHSLTVMLASATLAAAGASAHAQNRAADDEGLGRRIAEQGLPGSVAACASCHGAQGEGNAASGFPRIAGQPQYYLSRQLTVIAEGKRKNAIMEPIAKALTPQQIDAVSGYYAAQAAPSSRPAQAPADKALARGKTLATVGDAARELQACANCHGPGGMGNPPAYPYLAGQYPGYLVAALGEWKSGVRNTDPSRQMSTIGKRLSDDDIAAVAAYYAAQPAPTPAARRVSIPARPAASGARPANVAGPGATVGAEQGVPTTGGSQGPGGDTSGSRKTR